MTFPQPFWDVLPFEEFSVRVGRAEVHRLVDLLDQITPEQLKRLQVQEDLGPAL